MSKIINIPLDKLKLHPQNVRKKYEGIEELAESIKARGVLQNLTVVPDKSKEGTYIVVIGNRRLTAAKQAGISTLPCIVEEMEEKEQIETMLLENMQRNDLTVYEEAQGFQMVLDLGETEEELAKKTGFSKTTIRRRLNIAKLDGKLMSEKEEDKNFQIRLTDLYELEKISDVEKRNELLSKAENSKELIWRVNRELSRQKREENEKKLIEQLEEKGIKKAPKNASQERYTNKWETVQSFNLEKDVPTEIKIKVGKIPLYYLTTYSSMDVIRRTKDVKRKLTPAEKEKAEKESRKKKIKARTKDVLITWKDFIMSNIVSGKVKVSEKELYEPLWSLLTKCGCYVSDMTVASFFSEKKNFYENDEEIKENLKKRAQELSLGKQMIVVIYEDLARKDLVLYNGKYSKLNGELFLKLYDFLKIYGYTYSSSEEQEMIQGTSELYTVEEE